MIALQGWAMDDERLKNGGSVLSERRFYQKITHIYVTSLDYDASAKTTRRKEIISTIYN